MHPQQPRIRPIAACLCAAFSLSAPIAASASSYVVNTCSVDDTSAGTLRWAIAAANDLDHIDLHTSLPMACSTITLTAGELKPKAAANNLYLDGPSDRTLTIFQSQGTGASGARFRILNHTGTGTLGIYNLTLDSGKYYSAGSGAGGCIYSAGYVIVDHSTITNCMVTTTKAAGFPPAIAQGGAIYAKQGVKLTHSRVTNSHALDFSGGGGANNQTSGGGIATGVRLRAYYSTISGNSALAGNSNDGGAASVGGNVSISNSTIDSNNADFAAAINQSSAASGSYLQINNSTVSGNQAALGAAIYGNSKLYIYNSTIAFNFGHAAAAVDIDADAVLINSILAKNTTDLGGFNDLYVTPPHSLTGSHNLIVSSSQSIVGGTTLTGDPRLTPLAYHGGETRVHALLATSPAVNAGVSVATTVGNGLDQRGAGFSHFVGAAPDIGAYERQNPDDEIFYSGFD